MSKEFPNESNPLEGSGDEIIDQGSENENKVESNEEHPKVPADEYRKLLDQKGELEQRIADAEKASKENNLAIRALRESMGLPEDPDFITASDKYRQGLQEQVGGIDEIIEDKERETLGSPEEEGEDLKTMEMQMKDMEREMEEENSEMTRESREKHVKDYIEFCINDMKEYFKPFLSESENGNEAMKLMELKTKTEVTEKAEDFIEEGDMVELSFRVELTAEKFDKADGNQEQYITEVKFNFHDDIFEKDEKKMDESKLVDSKGKADLAEADKAGNLEEVEKK